MSELNPPVYGPIGGFTWVHWSPVVEVVPPVPPSAT
jgi:hypothetical protein